MGTPLKPICVSCHRFFRPWRNGINFTEMMPRPGLDAGEAKPGNAAPGHWVPYKVWHGDLWGCEGCGTQIIVGVAPKPWAEHYEPDFEHTRLSTHADKININDC